MENKLDRIREAKEKNLIAMLFEKMIIDTDISFKGTDTYGNEYNCNEEVIEELLDNPETYQKISNKIYTILNESVEEYIEFEILREKIKYNKNLTPVTNVSEDIPVSNKTYYAVSLGECFEMESLEEAREFTKENGGIIIDEQFQAIKEN